MPELRCSFTTSTRKHGRRAWKNNSGSKRRSRSEGKRNLLSPMWMTPMSPLFFYNTSEPVWTISLEVFHSDKGLLRIGFWGLGCLAAIVAGVKPLCCSCRFLTVNWCWCSGREFVSNMCRMTTMSKEQANIGMGPKIHMSSVTYLQKYCIRRECRIFHGYSIIYQRHEPWD